MQVTPQFCAGSPKPKRAHSSRPTSPSPKRKKSAIDSTVDNQSPGAISKVIDILGGKFRLKQKLLENGNLESKLYKGPNNSRESLKSNITLGKTQTLKGIFKKLASWKLGSIDIKTDYRRSKNPKNDVIGDILFTDFVDQSDAQRLPGNPYLYSLTTEPGVPASKTHRLRLAEFEDPDLTKKMDDLLEQQKKALKDLETDPSNSTKQERLKEIRLKFYDQDFGGEYMWLAQKARVHYRTRKKTLQFKTLS
jgi:hypothetical protein